MKPPDLPEMGWCDRPLPAIQFKKRVEDAHGDDDEDDLVAASPLRALRASFFWFLVARN